MLNKLADCKPPVLAKQRMKQFNMHVNEDVVVERQVGKKVFNVGCSIVINSDMHFSNYFYYFKILYTRASNKNMS